MLKVSDYFDIIASLFKINILRMLTKASVPRVMAYTVTWRCNAGCEMCGIRNVKDDLKSKEKELTSKDISRIFKDSLLKKLDLIRFTGGEPFLKEDFTEIVDEIIKNTDTKIYYITTNGFYTDRIEKFVKTLAPKTKNLVIQISLDAIGKLHDDIRKIPDLHKKAIETLEVLKKLTKTYSFSFGVNQTITLDTVGHIEAVSLLCNRLGCDHKVYMAHETHESDIMEGNNLTNKLSLFSNLDTHKARELYEKVEDYYQKEASRENGFSLPEVLWKVTEREILKGSKNRVLLGRAFPNPPCLSFFYYFRLLPDGLVMPCTLKPRAIGDLKKKTFSEIWKSKEAKDMRSEVKKCKGCWVECDIVSNIVYSLSTVRKMIGEILSSRRRKSK